MQQKHRASWCVRTSITAAERSIVAGHDALGSKETGPLHPIRSIAGCLLSFQVPKANSSTAASAVLACRRLQSLRTTYAGKGPQISVWMHRFVNAGWVLRQQVCLSG